MGYLSGHMAGEGLQSLEEINWEKNSLWCKGRIENMHFILLSMLEGVFGKEGGKDWLGLDGLD